MAHCYRHSSIVCQSVTTVSPATMAELIKMLFGMWIQVGSRNHVLDGGRDTHTQKCNFEGETGPTQDMSDVRCTQSNSAGGRIGIMHMPNWRVLDGVHIGTTWRIRLNHPYATAMRPYVKLLNHLLLSLVSAHAGN